MRETQQYNDSRAKFGADVDTDFDITQFGCEPVFANIPKKKMTRITS